MLGLKATRPDVSPEHVEIVNLAQRILQSLQILAPALVVLRQEIFYRVAQALNADAKRVPRRLTAVAQCEPLKFSRLVPPLQSQVLKRGST